MSCSPQHYVFTDCHEAVLAKLNKNLFINGYQRNEDSNCHNCGTEDENGLPKYNCVSKSNTFNGSYWSFELAKAEQLKEELQCSDNMEQETVCNTTQECNKCYGSRSIHPPSEKAVDKNFIGKVQKDHQNESREREKTNVASIRLDWEDVSMDDLEGLSCGVIVATGKY